MRLVQRGSPKFFHSCFRLQSYRILSELGSAVFVSADVPYRLRGYVPRTASTACSQNGLPPSPLLELRVWLGDQSPPSLHDHAESWCPLFLPGLVSTLGFPYGFSCHSFSLYLSVGSVASSASCGVAPWGPGGFCWR